MIRSIVLVRLVVSDVDGTLIYKNEKLNKRRFPIMLQVLADSDIPFVAATGRHYREMKKLFCEQTSNFISVCCNGAYAVANENLIYSLPVPKIAVKQVFDQSNNTSNFVEFHSVDRTYILGATDAQYARSKSRFENVVRINSCDQINDEIYFISIYGKNINISHESLKICYSADGIVEFVNRNTSKYNTVHFLAKALGIDDSEIMSFGDAENDNELLQKSGIAYTTYCANKTTFMITENHTRDVIGTVINLFDKHKKFTTKEV